MKERIKGLIDVDWRKIKALQPDDVKINTNINALKKSLKNHGFSLPFAVWKDDNVIYKSCKITVPILPFSMIDEMGAGMYKGKKVSLQERKLQAAEA